MDADLISTSDSYGLLDLASIRTIYTVPNP